MGTNQPDVKPSPLLHCEKVYFKMRQDATETYEGEVPMVVWEGFTTRLLKELELAVPYYSTIRTALMKMGCIKQLRRGGGTSPSQWELIKEPTLALWHEMLEQDPTIPASTQTGSAASKSDVRILGAKLSDLTERVEKVEENLKYLVNLFNEQLQKKGA
jgi:hypothetical protein